MFHQVNKVIHNIVLPLLKIYLIDCKNHYWIWVADSNVNIRILSDDNSSERNLAVTGTCRAPEE